MGKKGLIIKLLFIFLTVFLLINFISASEKIDKKIINELQKKDKVKVIVKFKANQNNTQLNISKLNNIPENITKSLGKNKIKKQFSSFNGFSAEINQEDIRNLENSSNVEAVYYDKPVNILLQDSIQITNATRTWQLQQNNLNLTGNGQTVCIIDTGIDYTHPDLGGCTLSNYNSSGNNESYILQSAHPYADNFDYTWNITMLGYEKIAIHFTNISLEYASQGGPGSDSYDRIIIYDKNKTEIANYNTLNGSILRDIWTPYSEGDTIYVRLRTDEALNNYGFYMDQIKNGSTSTTYNWSNCSKVLYGWDFTNNDANPLDDHGHGTHVAGIVAADGIIKGIAPSAKLVAAKVLDSSGSGYSSDTISAIEFCTNISEKYNISIISMSLGDGIKYTNYCDSNDWINSLTATAINNAFAKNISVIVASGNEYYTDGISSPACIQNAIPVGSVTKSDVISSFSNRNFMVKLFAPGSNINSTLRNGGYTIMSGTSMATPMVAGAYALINQYLKYTNQTKTSQEIENILWQTGKNFSENGNNFSRINVYNTIITLDNQKPIVNLTSPENNTNTYIKNQTFYCNATDLSLKNMTFYLWNSSSLINQTFKNITGRYYSFNINITNLSDDSYNWGCVFIDENNNPSTNFNYSLIIDTSFRNLSFVYPTDINYTNKNFIIINVSTTERYVSNITLRIYNSTNQINSTINNLSSLYFNFSNLTDGIYYFNATACNLANSCNSTETKIVIIDTVNPIINLIYPENNYSTTPSEIIFKYNVSDINNLSNCSLLINNNLEIVNNSIIKNMELNFTKTLSGGNYNWSIECTDESGNIANSSKRAIQITNPPAASSGGGGGGGGSGNIITTNTYNISYTQLEQGQEKSLQENDKIIFNINNYGFVESHSLTVNRINANYVSIVIRSNPLYLNISLGETKKLNLSSPNYYDLLVKLNSIIGNKVNLTIKKINESISQINPKNQQNITLKVDDQTELPKNNSNLTPEIIKNDTQKENTLIFIILIILFLLILGTYLIKNNFKKKIKKYLRVHLKEDSKSKKNNIREQ